MKQTVGGESFRRHFGWLVIAGYVAIVAGVVASLLVARSRTLDNLDTRQGRADWQTWREEARRQEQGQGPVKRVAPRSEEPPTVVLLRDHFATCVAAAIVVTTFIYAMLILAAGAIRQSHSTQPPHEPAPH